MGTWGWLDLWRSLGAGVFTAAKAENLSALAPVITTGLRHCSARQFQAGKDAAAPPHPQAVLVLADNLGIGRYTVEDAFKSLFGKCGLQSRDAPVAMATGH